MSKRHTRCLYAAFIAGALTVAVSAVQAQDKEVVIGLQCDRTGATQIVGTTLCPAYHDYVALVNSKGGIEGYKVKVLEIDHEYKVPPGMEAHERFKKDGAVLEGVYGTPHIAALNKKLEEDKILARRPASAPPQQRTASATPTPSRSRPAIGRKVRPRSSSRRTDSAAASRARRSLTSTTTILPARNRLP